MIDPDQNILKAFWRDVAAELELGSAPLAGHFHFGNTVAFANHLVDEVLNGAKRATAGLVAEMDADGETLPTAGDYWIVVDGNAKPRLVIRTLEVRQAPFHSVDEAFAWDEGEGDRSLGFWRRVHLDYFGRSCERLGIDFSEDQDVVFERFDVVWPSSAADRLLLRRPCTDHHWAAYHQLRRSVFERYLPEIAYDPDFSENWKKDVFHVGMISASELLGCLQMRWLTSTEAAFQLVGVEEQRRGEGIGRQMLLEAEVFARTNGKRLLRVFAEPEALGFYRKLGFVDGADWALQPLSARAIPLKKALAAGTETSSA